MINVFLRNAVCYGLVGGVAIINAIITITILVIEAFKCNKGPW